METTTLKLEKLELLEARIGATIEKMSELGSRYDTLSRKNEALEEKLADLTSQNSQLGVQLDEVKASSATNGADDKEILSRIDRMLEKFGELQI